jgi:hypothetical protein
MPSSPGASDAIAGPEASVVTAWGVITGAGDASAASACAAGGPISADGAIASDALPVAEGAEASVVPIWGVIKGAGDASATSSCVVGGAIPADATIVTEALPVVESAARVLAGVVAAVFKRARSPFGRSGVPGEEMTDMIFAMTPDAYGSASVQRREKGTMFAYKSEPPGAVLHSRFAHPWHSTT